MAKRKPPTCSSYVMIHGEPVKVSEMSEDGIVRDAGELTPEERRFVRDRLRYQYVQAEIQRYARYLKKPVEPVGRFAEEGALD